MEKKKTKKTKKKNTGENKRQNPPTKDTLQGVMPKGQRRAPNEKNESPDKILP